MLLCDATVPGIEYAGLRSTIGVSRCVVDEDAAGTVTPEERCSFPCGITTSSGIVGIGSVPVGVCGSSQFVVGGATLFVCPVFARVTALPSSGAASFVRPVLVKGFLCGKTLSSLGCAVGVRGSSQCVVGGASDAVTGRGSCVFLCGNGAN